MSYTNYITLPNFKAEPIICKKDAHSEDNKLILQKAQIYLRTDKAASEIIPSVEDMRELLGRSISKKSDELLNIIKPLIKGELLWI